MTENSSQRSGGAPCVAADGARAAGDAGQYRRQARVGLIARCAKVVGDSARRVRPRFAAQGRARQAVGTHCTAVRLHRAAYVVAADRRDRDAAHTRRRVRHVPPRPDGLRHGRRGGAEHEHQQQCRIMPSARYRLLLRGRFHAVSAARQRGSVAECAARTRMNDNNNDS